MHSSTKHVHSECDVRASSARSPQETTNTLSIFGAVNREVERVAQDLPELQAGHYRRVDGMGVGKPMLRHCFLYKRSLVHTDRVLLAVSRDTEPKEEIDVVTTGVLEVFGEVSHEFLIVFF
jgi:hypothetical protein